MLPGLQGSRGGEWGEGQKFNDIKWFETRASDLPWARLARLRLERRLVVGKLVAPLVGQLVGQLVGPLVGPLVESSIECWRLRMRFVVSVTVRVRQIQLREGWGASGVNSITTTPTTNSNKADIRSHRQPLTRI